MPREIRIDRFMLRRRELLVAWGAFAPLFEDHREHARRWAGEPQGLALRLVQQGLAAAGLYITFRALDEQTAWTVNLAEPPLNVFLAADARAGTVVGRHFEEGVATTHHSRLYVQSVRTIGPPRTSLVEIRGLEMLAIFEQYFEKSEQWPARFFAFEGDGYLMLSALPGIDAAWLAGLDLAGAQALLADPDLQRLDSRPLAFGCTCDEARMLKSIRALFAGKEAELFRGDPRVEVQCPRCGRSYTVELVNFRAADE